MSCDLLNENLVTLDEAVKIIPPKNGKRIHKSTLYRWALRGVRGGIRLETVFYGGVRCTSREALQRFLDQINQRQPGERVLCRSPAQRQRDSHNAHLELKRRGF